MAVRFYVDADALGLGKVLAGVRSDVTYPGDPGGKARDGSVRPPCPITEPSTDDTVWLPVVALAGWTVITKDKKIRRRPAELAAVRDNGARMVMLAGKRASTLWDQLTIVTRHWDQIEEASALPGPLIRRLTHRGMVKVEVT